MWSYTCVLLLLVHSAWAMPQGFGRKRDVIPTIKSDVKYVRCEMCEKTAKHIHRSIGELRQAQPSWKKLSEIDIIEALEKMCLPDEESGDWLTRLDVQEEGDRLRVIEMPTVGDCRRECATLARICTDLIGEHDIDLSELLVSGATRSSVTQALCYDLTGACTRRPPPFAGPRPDGEDFEALDPETLRLRRMMASMGQQGMSGELFDRESAMQQLEHYNEQLEDYGVDIDALKQQAGVADEL